MNPKYHKTKLVAFRISIKKYQELCSLADRQEVSVSSFIRDTLFPVYDYKYSWKHLQGDPNALNQFNQEPDKRKQDRTLGKSKRRKAG